MFKKLKYVASGAAVLLTVVFAGVQVSAEEQIITETVNLLQDGGLYETSYSVQLPLYEASTMEAFEEAVAKACRSYADELNVSSFNIPATDIGDMYFSAITNSGDLFYVSNTYSYAKDSDGYVTRLIFNYDYTQEEAEPMIEALDEAVEKAMAGVDENWSEVETALYFHEYLVSNSAYTSGYYDMYELLVNKRGVCQSYAIAYNYFLRKLDMQSKIVTSDSLDHAWNLIRVDNEWYYVDVSWDDVSPDTPGKTKHNNFLRSKDGFIAAGHTDDDWTSEASNVYDTATGTKYDDYFWSDLKVSLWAYNSKWFYAVMDGIYCYDFETAENTLFYEYNHIWYVNGVSGSYYTSAFTGTGIYDNRFVFNSPNTLYSIELTGMFFDDYKPIAVEEHTVDPSVNGYLYGFSCDPDGLVTLVLKDNAADTTVVTETFQLDEKNVFFDMAAVQTAEEGSVQSIGMLAKDLSKCRIKLGEDGEVFSYAEKTSMIDVTIPEVDSTCKMEWYYSIDSGTTWTASGVYTWVLSDYESTLTLNANAVKPGSKITASLSYKNWVGEDNAADSYRFILFKAEDVDTEDIRNTDESKAVWYSGDIASNSVEITLPDECTEYVVAGFAVITIDGTEFYMYPECANVTVEEFVIKTQPVDFEGAIGDTAKFTIEATGVTSYQWQQNTGAGWTAINTTAARSKTFSIGVAKFRLNYQYRCVISDGTNEIISDAVKMVVEEELAITTQPTDFTGAIGDTAKFTIDATGATSYQWEQNTGAGWTAINTTAGRSKTFSVGVAQFRLGYKYRCVVSDGTNTLTSNEVKMVVEEELAITSQPTDFTGAIGDTAKFTIAATGATSYQWEQNTGAGWTAINTTAGRSKTFSVGVAQFRLGYKYRCVVSDGTKTLTSNEVKMVVEEELAITSQPTNFTGAIGDTAKFTIAATGATSYQWEQNTGAGWTAINTTVGRSKTFSVGVAQFRLGYKYRCVVSDGTNTLTSNEVQMILG